MFNKDYMEQGILQAISKYPLIRIILGVVSIGLISAAIGMELLPEDEAKVFVIPTLVAALFAGVGILSLNHVKY